MATYDDIIVFKIISLLCQITQLLNFFKLSVYLLFSTELTTTTKERKKEKKKRKTKTTNSHSISSHLI